jgi:hypothetical protein
VRATGLPNQLLESMKIAAYEDADPFRNADYSERPNQNMWSVYARKGNVREFETRLTPQFGP